MKLSEVSRDALVIVARAVKTKGLAGEVVAEVLTDFPERFEGLSQILGLAPNGTQQQLELERYSFQNDRLVLKFSGYDTVESAKALVGWEFAVPEEDRVELSEDEFYDWELEGCSVEVNDGSVIGTVREVLRTGGVELIIVDDDAGHERLIPLAQSIVVEVDIEAKRIVIDPPDGLLDL